MDLLVIACTAFFLILALMREQRAALITELDHKNVESEGQRRMLETVFDSMSDGVVIVDNARVSMYNAAARQLLGRPMPAGTPSSWADDFGLTAADGTRLSDEALREALWVDADDPRQDAPGARRERRLLAHARHDRPADRLDRRTARRWCCCTTSPPSARACAS